VDRQLAASVGVDAGDVVTLDIAPVAAADEPEPVVPTDVRKALAAISGASGARAREIWSEIATATVAA